LAAVAGLAAPDAIICKNPFEVIGTSAVMAPTCYKNQMEKSINFKILKIDK
jgi:hypothetical protein